VSAGAVGSVDVGWRDVVGEGEVWPPYPYRSSIAGTEPCLLDRPAAGQDDEASAGGTLSVKAKLGHRTRTHNPVSHQPPQGEILAGY
jgi:hypothetical protein